MRARAHAYACTTLCVGAGFLHLLYRVVGVYSYGRVIDTLIQMGITPPLAVLFYPFVVLIVAGSLRMHLVVRLLVPIPIPTLHIFSW